MLKLGKYLPLKNCIEPFSYARTAYVVASALVSIQLFCKNLGNLQKVFGQMVYRPLSPPGQKIARTPMGLNLTVKQSKIIMISILNKMSLRILEKLVWNIIISIQLII